MAKTTNKYGWRLFDLDDNLDLTIVNEAVEGIENTLTRGTPSQLLTGNGELINTTNIPASGSTQPFTAGGAHSISDIVNSRRAIRFANITNQQIYTSDSRDRMVEVSVLDGVWGNLEIRDNADNSVLATIERGEIAFIHNGPYAINIRILRNNGGVTVQRKIATNLRYNLFANGERLSPLLVEITNHRI